MQEGGDFRSFVHGAHDYIKRNKLISRGLRLLPHPIAVHAANAAEELGYGHQKRGGATQVIHVVHHHKMEGVHRHKMVGIGKKRRVHRGGVKNAILI